MNLQARLALFLAGLTLVVFVVAGLLIREFAEQDMKTRIDEKLEEQIRVISAVGVLERIYHDEIQFLQRRRSQRPGSTKAVSETRLLKFEMPMRLIFTVGRTEIVIESEGFPALKTSDRANGFSDLNDGFKSWRILTRTIKPVNLQRGVAVNDVTVLAAISPNQIQQANSDLQKRLLLVGALVTVIAGLSGGFIGYRVIQPLGRLRKDAAQVRDTEDLSVRIEATGPPEIKALAEELNAMLSRLESATTEISSALSVSREFGSNVAHELRTPLTSMRLNLDLLKRGDDLNSEDHRAAIQELLEQQDRLLKTLDALRLLSRGDLVAGESNMDEVDLFDVITESVNLTKNQFPDIEFVLELSDNIPTLTGWREGLDVMLRNLFENARVHCGLPNQDLSIRVSAKYEDGYVVVEVEDNGNGIPETERERVFERFYTGTTGPREGSGLGLSLVQQQMTIHGGSVVVRTSALGGACVSLSFPSKNNTFYKSS